MTPSEEQIRELRRAIEEKLQGTKRNLMVASRAMRSHGDDAYAAQLALIGAELTELDGQVTDVLQLLSQLSAADARAEEQEPPCSHERLKSESIYMCRDCGARGPMTNDATFKPFTDARAEEKVDNGNIYIFCDTVDPKQGGCLRGAGHNGDHIWSRPLCPVVLPARAEEQEPQAAETTTAHGNAPDDVAWTVEVFREDDGRYAADYRTGDGREGGMGEYSATPIGALAELCATLIKIAEDKSIDARAEDAHREQEPP